MKKHLSKALCIVRDHRVAIAIASSLVTLVILGVYPSIRGLVWSVAVLDFVVIISTIVVLVMASLNAHPINSEADRSKRRIDHNAVTAIVAALAIFVTYASFRNQSRLAAEVGLNAEGLFILDIEMNHPNLRCIYTNFAHDNPNACLQRLISDPDQWSEAIFYIEESLWLIEKSEEDRKDWGSIYSRDITYWRQYVNEDPTGLFSYYLVSFYGNKSDAKTAMDRAALNIPGLCSKYRHVHAALVKANASPEQIIDCRG